VGHLSSIRKYLDDSKIKVTRSLETAPRLSGKGRAHPGIISGLGAFVMERSARSADESLAEDNSSLPLTIWYLRDYGRLIEFLSLKIAGRLDLWKLEFPDTVFSEFQMYTGVEIEHTKK